MSFNTGTCGPIDGNPDFYGLGIRIGIYLQWISTWLSLLVDPNSAQSTYDGNSVFVFAIAIATIVAIQSDATRPIEIYIMLQITIGFFATSLSTMGVRFYFLSPDRLAQLLDGLQNSIPHALQDFCSAMPKAVWTPREATLFTLRTWLIPLKILSPLKPPHLSWSGVAWRMATAVLIASLNLSYWFEDHEPSDDGCGPPFVFMFSKQQLQGPIIILNQISAAIIVSLVYAAAFILSQLTFRLHVYCILILYRDVLYMIKPDLLKSPKDHVNIYPAKKGSSFQEISAFREILALPLTFNTPFNTWTEFIEFLSTPSTEAIHFSDVLKAAVALGTGTVFVTDQRVTDREGRSQPSSWTGAKCVFASAWPLIVAASKEILGLHIRLPASCGTPWCLQRLPGSYSASSSP
jgi:hypothetical protein